MGIARVSGAGLAVAALLVSVTAGCSKDEGPTPSSSSSAASSTSAEPSPSETSASSAPADYSNLLIPATDVGDNATTAGPPQLNPGGNPGVGQVFESPDGKHRVVDTILVFPDTAAAESNFNSNKATLNEIVTGATEPIDVGTNGTIATGTSPDGSKAVTVIMFSEGKALVHLSFEGPPGDNVPQEIGQDIATKQADAVKAGLPE